MFSKRVLFVLLTLTLSVGVGTFLVSAQDPTNLTILTHWAEERLLEAQGELFADCEASLNVNADLQTVPFEELLTKIITNQTAGTNTDIIHMYNLWLPDFESSELLAPPPQEVVDEILANVPQGVIDGITVNDQVWGWPTEVNTYLLIYNKRLLEEAGYTEPPATWAELEEMAAAISQTDDSGAVTQVGYAVWPGWDSGIVHPWSSLLFSNGGQYLAEDMSATAFNSPQGQETLQLYADLLASGGIDMSVPTAEFANGRVGMVIMANWWRSTLQNSEAVDYETEVGVAPVPVGPSGEDSSTLSYNWLWSVTSSAQNPDLAWDFIRCINTPATEGEGSAMGNFLVRDLGAIPSMLYDQQAFESDLSDHFLAPFVESVSYAVPEPVTAGGQEVKVKLQTEIENVLNGLTDPLTAIEFAAMEGDAVLAEMAAQ